jgi:hypothetical protein
VSGGTRKAGLIGPVAFCAALFLIVLSPVLRGGNRHVALVVLESLALFLLLCVYARAMFRSPNASRLASSKPAFIAPSALPHSLSPLVWVLLVSPIVLGLIYLVPIPQAWWLDTPGRAVYTQVLQSVGLTMPDFLPLSLNPLATWTSLLAAIPVIATFIVGQSAQLNQLRTLAKALVACAFLQVVVGVLQLTYGPDSVLYFDGGYHDSAIGSFANRSHYANYIAMILPLYAWLGFTGGNRGFSGTHPDRTRRQTASATGRKLLWILGGAVLVFGILISRSRGAALTGLPLGLLAIGVLAALQGMRLGWRILSVSALILLVIVGVLFGFDFVSSRYLGGSLGESASFRGLLASSSLDGAIQFWPWGAGWGAYEAVYPRFQPALVAGYAEYAHHDYIQMVFEGGIFAVVLLCIWFWLFLTKAGQLVWLARSQSTLDEEFLLSVVSGMALVGVMLHALVEFSLHIPANAILAALLAGIYLRKMRRRVSRGLKE